MKNILIFFCLLLFVLNADLNAQKNAQKSSSERELFRAVYPIGNPPNIGYKTNMESNHEHIIFEANPILRMKIYNNILSKLMNGDPTASTLYIIFKPQFRMYDDPSLPVKTPSYQAAIGFQKIFRLAPPSVYQEHFIAFSIESGHYSNGQQNCAFDPNSIDGSAACDSVYRLINNNTNLSEILNRESGNFSTNFTEFIFNYRFIRKMEETIPTSGFSFKGGINIFHNRLLFVADIGGYTKEDIAIYGQYRFLFGAEYFSTFPENWGIKKRLSIDRLALSFNAEYISAAHPSVQSFRAELTGSLYFKNNVGVFVSGIIGHDHYNYRFVDSGTQLFTGVTFDIFPPMEIKR